MGYADTCGSQKLTVYPPDKLLAEEQNNISVMVCLANCHMISVYYQLKTMGVYNCFASTRGFNKQACLMFESNAAKIEEVKGLLADEHSKYIYSRVMCKRIADEIDYSDISEGSQYFLKDIFPVDEDEVFVDAGMLEGDAIEGFINYTDGNYKKIYGFEPDKRSFDIAKEKFGSLKAELHQKAVYDKPSELYFIGSQQLSEADGEYAVKAVRIDDIVSGGATFIKMDIEGCELQALYGAEKTVKEYQPKLAVCLYHKDEDLWEIPLLIKKWYRSTNFIYGTIPACFLKRYYMLLLNRKEQSQLCQ